MPKRKNPPTILTPEPEPPEWITRQEAAKLLGVNIRTVDRRIIEGKIKTKQPKVIRGRGGIRLLVSRADVEALASDE
jgi:excisionase family DNA binding protein